MTSNGDSTITRLMYETQVLKAVIDDLASKLKKMEGTYAWLLRSRYNIGI